MTDDSATTSTSIRRLGSPVSPAQAEAVGERGLGSILVHQYGSSQRWRMLFEGGPPTKW